MTIDFEHSLINFDTMRDVRTQRKRRNRVCRDAKFNYSKIPRYYRIECHVHETYHTYTFVDV